MPDNVRIRLFDYFYWGNKTVVKRPLLAAATVGLTTMGLAFLLGTVVSIMLAILGVSWGIENTVLLVGMAGSTSVVLSTIFFLWHNHRFARPKRRSSLSLGLRAWEVAWSIAAALFCGACVATIAIVVTYGIGVLMWLFWPGPIDWQRQLIVYPPVIVGITAFTVGTVGYLIREWRLNKDWLRRVKAHPSH